MNIYVLLLLLVAAANTGLGLLILTRNTHNRVNRFFYLFAQPVALWAAGLALFLTSNQDVASLNWAKFYYVAPLFIAYTLVLLTSSFNNKRQLRAKEITLLAIPALALTAFIVLQEKFLVEGITHHGWGKEVVLNKFHYVLYSVYFLAYFYGATLILYRIYRRARGALRGQLQYLLLGIVIAGTFGVTFNLVLPALGNYRLIWLGPQFLTIFVGTTAYAIVKHKLFDIRLVVARSLAYSLLLATLGLLYGAALFGVSSIFFPDQLISSSQRVVNIALAILLAFTFQPLRRFFEKLTDKIFYHDKYDSQQVLSQLGNVFASQIDINIIIQASLQVLADSIKPTHALLLVLDANHIYKHAKFGDVPNPHMSIADLKHLHNNLYLADELEHGFIKTYLDAHDMSAVLRLVTQEGVVGFVFLGPKQSGTIYTSQDAQLLDTAGPALAVAVQNARSFEKIADFNVTLQNRIHEATQRLKVQNQKLKELDEAKDGFISMASHQLRTPLTAIKGYLSMLIEGDAGKLAAKQHEFADLAFMSAERMVFLISDMLNVSRIQTGKLAIEKSPVDLEQIVNQEIKQLERTAESRSVVLNFDPPKPKLPMLSLDEGKIRQVVMNFMDNAIYYAPNTTVEISLAHVEDKVQFLVRDHGIGVPEKEKGHLFTKFFRAGNAQKARPDGTGLGLYMAKMVVELQGGDIIFDSHEGKGSTFGFEFSLDDLAVKGPAEAEATVPAKVKVPVKVH